MGKPFSSELLELHNTIRWSATQDVEGLKNFFFLNFRKPLICIGSGGSFSACHLAAMLYRNFCSMAIPFTPMELMEGNMKQKCKNKLLYISASGKNKDIQNAYKRASSITESEVCNLSMRLINPLQIMASESNAASYNYDLPSKKDGFLATNSLVAFFTILTKAFYGKIDTDGFITSQANIEHEAYEIKPYIVFESLQHFTVLYGEIGEPVAYDIESKLSEAALGTVQLSDYRNFGHGRHHWFDKRGHNSCIIAIITEGESKLAEKTIDNLPNNIPVIYIRTKFENNLATLDLLIKSFYFVRDLGLARGIDPGRPGVPGYGSKLYNLNYISLLKYPSNKTPIKDLAIARKCRVDDICQALPEVITFYESYYINFVKKLNSRIFSMIAFDYDGTLSRPNKSSRHSNCLDVSVSAALKTFLEHNIKVAIVTGRGKSIIEILKNSFDVSFHHLITIGLYNGMTFYNLAEVETFKSLEDEPLDCCLQILKLELDKLNPYPLKKDVEGRRDQLIIETDYSKEVYEICKEIINNKKLTSLSIWLSTHSMDVVVNTKVSKRNILNHHDDNQILCIGDCGMIEGNDFEMLSIDYSLSADRVSRTPNTCWNIAPEGVRGLDATLYYIKNIKLSDGTFKCQFEI